MAPEPILLQPALGEPRATDWGWVSLSYLAHLVGLAPGGAVPGSGRLVLAVDGRSGAGKSTLARKLADALPGSAVVSTDDLAWHAPMFGWAELAATGVLRPFLSGDPVRFRPPAWVSRNRPGAITVPETAATLVLEGVGAAQRALMPWLDAALLVQSDFATAERLGIARDVASGVNGDTAQSVAFWHQWMAAEMPFLAAERPWERAAAIVAGVTAQPAARADDGGVWLSTTLASGRS